MPLDAKSLIEKLDLQPHREGGYYRRTYQASDRPMVDSESGPRFLMTSIYYMLTREAPIGCFHVNQSDIMHVHNAGAALRYYLISPQGELQIVTLGPNIERGERMQFVVKGGYWKATELVAGAEHDFGLLTEVVVPGFDYADMILGKRDELLALFPQHESLIARFAET